MLDSSKPSATFHYNLTPKENSGESLLFDLDYINNGDGEFYTTEKFTLMSYGSCATIHTFGAITSEKLFKFATELYKFELTQQIKSIENIMNTEEKTATIEQVAQKIREVYWNSLFRGNDTLASTIKLLVNQLAVDKGSGVFIDVNDVLKVCEELTKEGE